MTKIAITILVYTNLYFIAYVLQISYIWWLFGLVTKGTKEVKKEESKRLTTAINPFDRKSINDSEFSEAYADLSIPEHNHSPSFDDV